MSHIWKENKWPIIIAIIIVLYLFYKNSQLEGTVTTSETDTLNGISYDNNGNGTDISGNDTETEDTFFQDVGIGQTVLLPEIQSKLPQDVQQFIEQYCAQYNLNSDLIKAQAWFESNGLQNRSDGSYVVSRTGAIGVMQLEPATAAGLGVDPYNKEQNIKGGVKYMAGLLQRYAGNFAHALMAYNWGAKRVDQFKVGTLTTMPVETSNYITHILNAIDQSPSDWGVNV